MKNKTDLTDTRRMKRAAKKLIVALDAFDKECVKSLAGTPHVLAHLINYCVDLILGDYVVKNKDLIRKKGKS